jgi:protein-tyrosine phosphatase
LPPFTVLHVCMGNICRSPMAERLMDRAIRERVNAVAQDGPVHSHSAGTGGWHVGEGMYPSAARQLKIRGASDDGFAARRLRSEHIDASDLVLTATSDQADYVTALRPDAAGRTFVLGEFGRLLAAVDPEALPPAGTGPEAVYARGAAIVALADAARAGTPALPTDDLDDPWGRDDRTFGRVADQIEETVHPFTELLLPGR